MLRAGAHRRISQTDPDLSVSMLVNAPAIGTPSSCWSSAFDVTTFAELTADEGEIRLFQCDPKVFRLGSTLAYLGETGLEGQVDAGTLEQIRRVGPNELATTDLASVPTLLRWFVGTYGVHTPAAVLHDRLIRMNRDGKGLVTDVQADRFFRFMLGGLGVPLFKRWIMWTGVALRSRWQAKGIRRLSIALWVVLATLGLLSSVAAVAAYAAGAGSVLGIGRLTLLVVAIVAPFVCGLLWGRQWAAAIVAALAVPWILPPTIFAAAGFGVYKLAEAVAGRFTR
jgi:hypothetical protein